MARRVTEIDVQLLLFAIQRTGNFEQLIAKRYTGVTITAEQVSDSTAVYYTLDCWTNTR